MWTGIFPTYFFRDWFQQIFHILLEHPVGSRFWQIFTPVLQMLQRSGPGNVIPFIAKIQTHSKWQCNIHHSSSKIISQHIVSCICDWKNLVGLFRCTCTWPLVLIWNIYVSELRTLLSVILCSVSPPPPHLVMMLTEGHNTELTIWAK